MAVDYEHMCGKIRAMRHSGYADHEIGYAIGLDVGKELETRRCLAVMQESEMEFRATIAALGAQMRRDDSVSCACIVAAFFFGGFLGWLI